MKALIEITTTNGQFYYDLLYFLAIGFAGIFFMIDGKQKKYPMAEWSLIFASAVVFLIIGTKLFTYSLEDWKEVVTTGSFPYTESKTILGGIIGGIIGIWITTKLTRFSYPVLDSFAVSFPIAMGIQRIGCFVVGCCYGTPADIPWSASYSANALPYYTHLDHGWIDQSSSMSVAIHPNQLYQTLLCALIAFLVWNIRNFWRRPGNLFFTSIGLYGFARFIVEFWRSPDSNNIGGNEWMGMKMIQWGLLMGVILMSAFILIRERTYMPKGKTASVPASSVWYFLILSFFVLLLTNWFTKAEFLFVESVLLPAFILQTAKALHYKTRSDHYRFAAVYCLLFVFILNGTLTGQKIYNDLTKSESSKNVFHDIQVEYGNLTYSHYHATPYANSGCDGTYYTPNGPRFKHKSAAFGVGYTQIRTSGPYDKFAFGGTISGGWDKNVDLEPNQEINTFDASVNGSYDMKWIGADLGIHFGKGGIEERKDDIFYTLDHHAKSYVTISGNFRLFPQNKFYVEVRRNGMLPYQPGVRAGRTTQYLIGSGFGMRDGSGLELGLESRGGYFITGKAMIHNQYGLSTSFYMKRNNNQVMRYFPQLSLTYRLSSK